MSALDLSKMVCFKDYSAASRAAGPQSLSLGPTLLVKNRVLLLPLPLQFG